MKPGDTRNAIVVFDEEANALETSRIANTRPQAQKHFATG